VWNMKDGHTFNLGLESRGLTTQGIRFGVSGF
jgi:hypothetical protein